jgi:hypothetical protein
MVTTYVLKDLHDAARFFSAKLSNVFVSRL